MKRQFYAVISGKVPGIYNSWNETEKMINGYTGAIYKGFKTLSEAQNFMSYSKEEDSKSKNIPESIKINIYTDGSFSENKGGYGVVIINGDESINKYGKVPETLNVTNNVAELYAIYVALSLVKTDVIIHTDSRYAISALTVYIHDWMLNGWNKSKNKDLIISIYNLFEGRSVNFVHVSGHSGDMYNDEADRIANMGRLLK
jgi:ribonuclease HI